MLTSITLSQFALADEMTVEIADGFNVLTGETGAGKSLLLDALAVCLGERADASQVRYGCDKAEIIAMFDCQFGSPEAQWLHEHELSDPEAGDIQEIVIRRVIFANGRSKAWINGRPSSIAELKNLGRLLVLIYSQHSQQQLLDPPYPRQWLDRYSGLQQQALEVSNAYKSWQQSVRRYQEAQQESHSRLEKIAQLEFNLQDVEEILNLNYEDIEQRYDVMSHHESLMTDCHAMLQALDDDDHNLLQQLAQLIRRAEEQQTRSPALQQVYSNLLNAQSELEDATATIRQFVDKQSFDEAEMAQLDEQLGLFHRLARKYRLQPQELAAQYDTWQQQLEQLQELQNPEILAQQLESAQQRFMDLAQQLDVARQSVATDVAAKLTEKVKTLALPEAYFEFEFEPLPQPSSDGLNLIKLMFSANKGIPPQPLARVASGGELSRIALVMQVMNATKTEAEVLVFDEIDVGISGGTAEIVGRMLVDLSQHVQILCITHQAQVAAQSDQHLLVQKRQTDPASSQIVSLDEDARILEIARMSGGVEISAATLSHAKQLRQLKFNPHTHQH